MPISNPTTTPTTTPTISPDTQPWHETYTSPDRICPQQVREGASPDIEP
jgi:hypothetical protein